MPTYYPQQMMPTNIPTQMYYPQMQYHPQMMPGAPQQIIFPLMMHPMHQISGPPIGQQQVQQMPQPAIPQNANNVIPQPPPAVPIPQPQMPQPQINGQPLPQLVPQSQSQPPLQPQPQPQHPFSPGPDGTANIPRSGPRNRVESASSSSSDSDVGRDRLTTNPLPRPPREVDVPPHLLAGSAMTYSSSVPPGPIDNEPLRNPLPPPPKDVYTSKKYRQLVVGQAYEDRQEEVYPEGWFDEHGHRKEGSRSGFLSRLNPFRDHSFSPAPAPVSSPIMGSVLGSGHRRAETVPILPALPQVMRESSSNTSESSGSIGRNRLFGFGRLGRKREKGRGIGMGRGTPFPRNVPSLAPDTVEVVSSPVAMPDISGGNNDLPIGFMPLSNPTTTPQIPPAGFSPNLNPNAGQISTTPQMPQPAIPLSPAPSNQAPLGGPTPQPQPQPSLPFSPVTETGPVIPPLHAAQGPVSPSVMSSTSPERPVVRFNASSPTYAGFCHFSPHRVLYDKRLYPSAAHLLLAHQFLENSERSDLAECIRRTENFSELEILIDSWRAFVRRDWAAVVIDKLEEVLYHKFVQHPELRELLLGTGLAKLIYADLSDTFLGEGPRGEGNELGKALMRIRERLRQEASSH